MGGSRLRLVAGVASVVLAGTGLAACTSANAGTGPVTLNFYFYPDTSKATVDGVANCNAQNGGKYTISYQQLPQAADGQRQQMVRRLAAHDDLAAIGRGQAEQDLGHLRAPGTDEPREAENLAASNRERHVADTRRPVRDVARLERHVAERHGAFGKHRRQLTADHQANELRAIDAAGVARGHRFAVAKDGDAV